MLSFIIGAIVGGTVVFVLFAILNVAKSDNCDNLPPLNNIPETVEESQTKFNCTFDE